MNHPGKKALDQALADQQKWKDSFGAWEPDPTLAVPAEKANEIFSRLSSRLSCNYPFHHPVYAGQMLKPPHEIAWAAYSLAMGINPNNHALDGGPPSSEMEKEVIAELAGFFGYGSNYLGHLTSSGTIANLEALWISREIRPDKKIAFSSNSHYTHKRMCKMLNVESEQIPMNAQGKFELQNTDPGGIGTIVVTLGTTGLGDVEPLDQILPWAKQHNIRVHVDAAYGGFFRSLKDNDLIDGTSWKLMEQADSIVVDPHKHGLQPYGCGCILFKDPGIGKFYKHDSPYTYFTSDDLHLGEISLECSRAGAAAVALWATLQCFPLKENEGFGPILAKCRQSALKGYSLLLDSGKLAPYKKPELDILTYYPVTDTVTKVSEISALSKKVFDIGMKDRSFYLSLFRVPSTDFNRYHPGYDIDADTVTILRSVLMKPELESYIPELLKRIEEAV